MQGESARRKGEALAAAGDIDAAKWLAGAVGERRVAQALETLPSTWSVIHDRLLMPGLTESNLDHVVIGHAGVILIDAKNFSGDVSVWGDTLYQHLGRGEGRTSRNLVQELRKVHWMACRISERLSMPVTPVLCLAGNRQGRFGEPQMVAGVWVVPVEAVAGWLRSLPTRIADFETVSRLIPRVMSEFPSTATDPELLAAIGRDLGRVSPTRGQASRPPGRGHRKRDAARPPMRRRTRRHPLTSLLWFVILAVLFFSAIPLLAGLGQQLGSLYVGRLMPDAPPVVTAPAVSAEPVAEEPQRQGDCHALSAETLSTYVKEPVWALHEPGGDCLWVTDRSDPRSAVVVVDWLEAYVVAHLSGDAPLVSESFDPVTRSRTSVLLARPIQWIPVADTRTEVRWPMRVRIMRDPLAITHERADQILRAVAADLNREAAVP